MEQPPKQTIIGDSCLVNKTSKSYGICKLAEECNFKYLHAENMCSLTGELVCCVPKVNIMTKPTTDAPFNPMLEYIQSISFF